MRFRRTGSSPFSCRARQRVFHRSCAEPSSVSPRQATGGSAEGPRSISAGAAERRARGAGILPFQKQQRAFLQLQTSALTQYFVLLTVENKLVTWAETHAGCHSPAPCAEEGMLPKAAGFCRPGRGGCCPCHLVPGEGESRLAPQPSHPPF